MINFFKKGTMCLINNKYIVQLTNKMKESDNQLEITEQPLTAKLRFRLLLLSIASSVALVLAVTFIIVLTLESFTGIASSTPLQLNSCNNSYFTVKYSSANTNIMAIYITSFLSIIYQICMCLVVFPPLIMRKQPTQNRLVVAYILASLQFLSALLAFGKYLAFQVDLHLMDSNCTVSYSEALIKVILSIATFNFFISIMQGIFMYWTITTLIQEIKKAEKYEAVKNKTLITTTENALEEQAKKMYQERDRMPIEIPAAARPSEAVYTPRYQEAKKARVEIERKETDFVSYSNTEMIGKPLESNHRTMNENEAILDKYPQLIRPDYNRNHSPRRDNSFQRQTSYQSQEESLQSLLKERKATLEMLANRPGPIPSVSRSPSKEQVNRTTHGYLNFVRRMNINSGNVNETEGELIASIRGKYGK